MYRFNCRYLELLHRLLSMRLFSIGIWSQFIIKEYNTDGHSSSNHHPDKNPKSSQIRCRRSSARISFEFIAFIAGVTNIERTTITTTRRTATTFTDWRFKEPLLRNASITIVKNSVVWSAATETVIHWVTGETVKGTSLACAVWKNGVETQRTPHETSGRN